VEIAQKIIALRERPAREWIAEANRVLPEVVAMLLVLFIAWHGATLLWALLPGQPQFDWSQQPVSTARTANPGIASGIDYRSIADAHLFGVASSGGSAAQVVKAPDTSLNLKLRGAIAADDESIAHAIIADSSDKANVYFIDDSLPGGATLHEVHVDRVILKRGGAFETLRLPKQSQSLGRNSAQRARNAAARIPTSSLRQAIGGNAATFTEIVRPQPFMPNGQMKGYRVYPGRDRRAFAALGLRPGDLVTEINGQKLDNLQSGIEVFRQLGDATQMTVTIERNGSDMQLILDSSKFNNSSGARK
jgi:general secretion pathway protein C